MSPHATDRLHTQQKEKKTKNHTAVRCYESTTAQRVGSIRVHYRHTPSEKLSTKHDQITPETLPGAHLLRDENRTNNKKPSRAVARKPRDAAAVLFGLKFADNIHYKFKSSQASKVRLQSSEHTGAKQNLTQNGHTMSLKITRFGVSGKVITD